MKLSLREQFLSPAALSPQSDPLVRLAALHHLHRAIDREKLQPRLRELLAAQDAGALHGLKADASIFSLQVAIALSQEGNFEGVQWLLTALGHGDLKLMLTAIRNCREFPLTVLMASAVSAYNLEEAHARLGGLAQFSDEYAWTLANGQAGQNNKIEHDLQYALAGSSEYLKPNHRLALGTAVTRPLRHASRFRHTGFLVTEEQPGKLRALTYCLPNVINRDDGSAQQNAWDLLREPGRKALAAYDSTSGEAMAVYLLPFARLAREQINELIVRMAEKCDGLSVEVVAHKWTDDRGERFRVITTDGQTRVDRYRAEWQKIGGCLLKHPSADKGFSTNLRLSKDGMDRIVNQFLRHTDLDPATMLRIWDQGYKLGSRSGEVIVRHGERPQSPVVLLEDAVQDNDKRKFPVELPSINWTARDRSDVLKDFFIASRENFAVVIHILTLRDGRQNALIVNPQAEQQRLWKMEKGVSRGTPVYWEIGQVDGEERVFTTYLTDQVVEAECKTCYDTGSRLCINCKGDGRSECGQCGGTGKTACGHCNGAGQRWFGCDRCQSSGNCHVCKGAGRYQDSGRVCKKCGGNGQCQFCNGGRGRYRNCKTCQGSGRWDCDICHGKGIAKCNVCNGTLVSECTCYGFDRIHLSPVA